MGPVVSFGCEAASQTMWVQNCRGHFQCLDRHHTTSCGYPPGEPFYNCSCSGPHSRLRKSAALRSSAERAEYRAKELAAMGPSVGSFLSAFLESICERLVHMVIKLDGQPASFPAVVSLGGDVDFLTTAEHFPSLQAAVTRFFGDRLGMLGAGVTSRAFSHKSSQWQFRMEQRGRLLYQVHLIQATDAEAVAMLGRRIRLVRRSPCLWEPAPADAVRLRNRDCVEKREAGRASSLCPTGPRARHGSMVALKRKEVLEQRSESYFRNLTLFFHTANATQLVLEERTPDFTNLSELDGWQRAIVSQLDGRPKRNHGAMAQAATEGAKAHTSCAVVGSAAALLTRNLGAEINAHETIIRTNQAPTRSYESYVGNRTDLRVWGFIPLPRDYKNKALPWASENNFLIYCPPVKWVSICWRRIANDQDPRFHPSAWRRAQRLIHLNRTRCKRLGCYPSSGIMAVLYAVDACERVSVYGFGINEANAQDRCACSTANLSRSAHGPYGGHISRHISRTANDACGHQQQSACAVGRACDKYYPRTGEPGNALVRAQHCEQVRQQAAAGQTSLLGSKSLNYGNANYFEEAATSHDLVQEWAWLTRLHESGVIRWRGQPGRATDTDGRKTHRMEP